MSGEELFAAFLVANEDAQTAMGVRVSTSPWAGSPFEWMMALPSRSRGKAGEELAAAWLRHLGRQVQRARTSDYDRIVDGRKVEIKLSTLWASGVYKFQQLRDQDYEFALLLGISPTNAHPWMVPKAEATRYSVPQHGGARGSDTRWLSFLAAAPPAWMTAYGGTLSACIAAMNRLLGA